MSDRRHITGSSRLRRPLRSQRGRAGVRLGDGRIDTRSRLVDRCSVLGMDSVLDLEKGPVVVLGAEVLGMRAVHRMVGMVVGWMVGSSGRSRDREADRRSHFEIEGAMFETGVPPLASIPRVSNRPVAAVERLGSVVDRCGSVCSLPGWHKRMWKALAGCRRSIVDDAGRMDPGEGPMRFSVAVHPRSEVAVVTGLAEKRM